MACSRGSRDAWLALVVGAEFKWLEQLWLSFEATTTDLPTASTPPLYAPGVDCSLFHSIRALVYNNVSVSSIFTHATKMA